MFTALLVDLPVKVIQVPDPQHEISVDRIEPQPILVVLGVGKVVRVKVDKCRLVGHEH